MVVVGFSFTTLPFILLQQLGRRKTLLKVFTMRSSLFKIDKLAISIFYYRVALDCSSIDHVLVDDQLTRVYL